MNCGIAYYRISNSANQQSLLKQKEKIAEYANLHGINIINEYTEQSSGMETDAPELKKLLKQIKELGDPSVIILISSLERLGRDAKQVSQFVQEVTSNNVRVTAVDSDTELTERI